MNKTAHTQKGFSVIIILIAIVALIGVSGIFYYFSSSDQQNGGITIEKGLNQETIKDEDLTIIVGDDIKLPSDFPESLPQYPGATVILATYENEMAYLRQTTNDTAETVITWYKKELVKYGWDIAFTAENAFGFESETQMGGVTILAPEFSEYPDRTVIAIDFQPNNNLTMPDGSTLDYTKMESMLKELEQKTGRDSGVDFN